MPRYEMPVYFEAEGDAVAKLIMRETRKVVDSLAQATAAEYLVIRHGVSEPREGTVVNKDHDDETE